MVRIYNQDEIEILRQGGKILANIMEELKKEVSPGVTTKYLNRVANDLVFSCNAQPSFLNYDGFPASLCTSINEEIVHAVPSKRRLKSGDMLSLDLGVRFKGYCTDMAVTVGVGEIDNQKKKMIKATHQALTSGINQARPGNYLGDIGYQIQRQAEKNGFNVVRELVGHGVGKEVHEDPQVFNFGNPGEGLALKSGMVLALEPMLTAGDWRIEQAQDGFGYITADNSLSCHFEHTIVITKRKPEILTKL